MIAVEEKTSRQARVERIAVLVNEFVVKVETDERFSYQPSRDHPAYADGKKPLPKTPVRRRWKTSDRGLLDQAAIAAGQRPAVQAKVTVGVTWCNLATRHEFRRLVQVASVDAQPLVETAAPLGGRPDGGRSRSGKPGSRPPGSTQVLEEYLLIVAGVDQLRRRVRRAAGRTAGARVPTDQALREIVGMLLEVDGKGLPVISEKEVDHVGHELRAWRSSARIALGYDVEIIQLPKRHCLECGGKLFVRKDASSDVWCRPTGGFVEGPALEGEPFPVRHQSCGFAWPRHTWIQLLQDPAVPREGKSA